MDTASGSSLLATLPRVPAPNPRTTVITDTDFAKMYMLASPWMRAFLLLCRTMGLRNAEARAIRPADYNPETNRLNFDRKMQGTSNLPVPAELAKLFVWAQQVAPDTPLLQTMSGRKICEHMLYDNWTKLRTRAGVSPSITIHDLRRTVAKRAYDDTKDLRIVQQILGHRRLSSTLQYIGSMPDTDLARVINDARPLDLDLIPLATEVKQ